MGRYTEYLFIFFNILNINIYVYGFNSFNTIKIFNKNNLVQKKPFFHIYMESELSNEQSISDLTSTEFQDISELENNSDNTIPINYYDIFNDKEQLIRYMTSFRKYTIISINNNGKDLFNTMINENFDTYYMDLNNITDKDSTLSYLIQKYKSYNSGEKLWVFRGDFFVGSREDMLDIIEKHK